MSVRDVFQNIKYQIGISYYHTLLCYTDRKLYHITMEEETSFKAATAVVKLRDILITYAEISNNKAEEISNHMMQENPELQLNDLIQVFEEEGDEHEQLFRDTILKDEYKITKRSEQTIVIKALRGAGASRKFGNRKLEAIYTDSSSGEEENPDATESSLKPFWLSSSFIVEGIDEAAGIVQLEVSTKWWWLSTCSTDVTLGADKGNGDIFQNELDPDGFPVHPFVPFSNQISIESLPQFMKAGCTKLPAEILQDGSPHAISENKRLPQQCQYRSFAQKVYKVTLRAAMQIGMRKYPLDRHLIPAILALRTSRSKVLWELLEDFPSQWFSREEIENKAVLCGEDRYPINQDCRWAFTGDLRPLAPELRVSYVKERHHVGLDAAPDAIQQCGNPALCLRFERDPTLVLFHLVKPTFIIVGIALASLYISYDDIQDVVTIVAVSFLTVVVNHATLNAKLPLSNKNNNATSTSTSTLATKYLTFAYIFLLIVVVKEVMIHAWLNENNQVAGTMGHWRGQSNPNVTRDVQDILTLALTVFWIAVHLIITCFGRVPILMNTIREDWERKIVPEEHWEHCKKVSRVVHMS